MFIQSDLQKQESDANSSEFILLVGKLFFAGQRYKGKVFWQEVKHLHLWHTSIQVSKRPLE